MTTFIMGARNPLAELVDPEGIAWCAGPEVSV